MITYVKGNIFNSRCQAIVNPCNCKGTMGAGLAKQFKLKFPEMFEDYKHECWRGVFHPGYVHIWWGNTDQDNPWPIVCNVATKNDWRNPSQLGWIQEGLWELRDKLEFHHISSVAIPPLGCGLGGLNWEDVRQAIEDEFATSPINVEVYEPL